MLKQFAIAMSIMSLVPAIPAFAEKPSAEHPEARPFDQMANAAKSVDAALVKADEEGKRVIVVMGANWCHDSRGLSGWFAKPKFTAMLAPKYEIVYVDVGQRDRNIDIAQRFGISKIKGTPTVLVLSAQGDLLNPKSAPTWRNAASRSEGDIFSYFEAFVPES